ncbi:glucose-6-phosphate dehydrogenase [Chiua virens]|nr:glucose-6-phosphate dehydrogenase [Chiua virens]
MSAQHPRTRSGTIPSMETSGDALRDNTVIVVFGASGDLAKKKTYPALFGLYRIGYLPRDVHIVGYARTKMDTEEYHKRITSYIKVPDNDPAITAKLEEFKKLSTYVSGGYEDAESFVNLTKHLEGIEKSYAAREVNRVFYLALPPSVFIPVAKNVKDCCYSTKGVNRIIVEKPFGKDLESCRSLLGALKESWSEDETYRIDHYLGKEMVKNLLVLRFGNVAMNAAWDRNSISNVQITFKEPFGTEGRGGYFDEFGIIRDIQQNHLLQVLSILTMERPVSFSAEDIRDEKVKVLRAISPIKRDDTLLGQYVAANGKPGYLDDDTVPKNSVCPTFAATVLWIKNPRWDGVPFIMKAGKALNEAKVEIRVQFKDVTEGIFAEISRNELVVRIQPSEAVYLKLNTKTPGYSFRAIPTEMDLTYKRRFTDSKIPEAYEALILDALKGDHSNFVRDDELDVAWKIFTPILHWIEGRDGKPPTPLPYPYGSRGPAKLDEFIEGYGYKRATTEYSWPITNVSNLSIGGTDRDGLLVVCDVEMDPPPTSCVRVRVLARSLSARVSDSSPPSHPYPTNTPHSLSRTSLSPMFPSPRDLLPVFHCPLCPPASVLATPTTLRCGHTICATHVHSTHCPIPTCSSQNQSFTPNIPPSSRVAFFPAPLATQDLPSDVSNPALDVRVNNIINLLRAEPSVPSSDPFGNSDDDSDPEDHSLPDPDPHRDDPDSVTSPLHHFEKALFTELTCEICFMLLYQPVTTPCQHIFCSQCLQRSLDHSMFCPLCRRELPSFAYFQEHPHNKVVLSLLLRAFPDAYSTRREAMERDQRDARLDTPIFVCQLSFPGMPTLLHFFEPRYRLMLRRCLTKPSPTFGMIVPPRAAPIAGHGPGAGSEFGTMLEIKSVQMCADGRSMVETWGTHRFRILEQGSHDGYTIGRVERIDDYDDDLAGWAAQDDEGVTSTSDAAPVDIRPPSPTLLTRIVPRVSFPPSPVRDSNSPRISHQFLSTAVLMETCHAFLSQLRAGTAPWVVQRLHYTYGPQPPDTDPAAFSFWMGMVLPIDEHEKAKLLPVKSARLRLRMVVGWIEQLNSNWLVLLLCFPVNAIDVP